MSDTTERLDVIEADLKRAIDNAASLPVDSREPMLSAAHKEYGDFVRMRYPDRFKPHDGPCWLAGEGTR